MSVPPACTVHTPDASVWPPAGVAPPMSSQLHGLAHAPWGTSTVPTLTASVSMDQLAAVPWFHESVAAPASSAPDSAGSDISEPGTAVHVLPSVDVSDW